MTKDQAEILVWLEELLAELEETTSHSGRAVVLDERSEALRELAKLSPSSAVIQAKHEEAELLKTIKRKN